MMRLTTALLYFNATLLGLGLAQAQTYDEQLAKSREAASEHRYSDAQLAAESAIRLDDSRWEGYVLAANAYSSQRFYDDAIGMLEMALPRAPEDKRTLVRDAISEAKRRIGSPTAGVSPSNARTTPPSSTTTRAERASELSVSVVRGPVGTILDEGTGCPSSMPAVGSFVEPPTVGRLQIGSDSLTYSGPDTSVSIQRAVVAEIRSEGSLVVFYSDADLWSFAQVDEADAKHRCVGSAELAKTVSKHWQFVSMPDGRLLQSADAPGALIVNFIYHDVIGRDMRTASFHGPLQITPNSIAFWNRTIKPERVNISRNEVEYIEVIGTSLVTHWQKQKWEFGSTTTGAELLDRISEKWGPFVPNSKGKGVVPASR